MLVIQSSSETEILISSRSSQTQVISEIWRLRELLWALTWRNIHVRYKQAAIGVFWIVIRPLLMVILYTVIFGMVANLPTISGVPYSIMVLSGLIIWGFVSQTITACASCFFSDAPILAKVYFPRLVVPMSHTFSGMVDFGITFLFLVALLIWKQVPVSGNLLALIPIFLFMCFFAFSFGLLLGVLTIKYRDVQHLTPFILQVGFYLSPVVYSSDIIPLQYRWLYYLNPIAGIVDSLRWCLFGQPIEIALLGESVLFAVITFAVAMFAFRAIEPIMIDQM